MTQVHFNYDEENHEYTVELHGLALGWLYCEIDGYYVYDINPTLRGYTPGWLLRAIADKLDELNKEWDKKIQEDPTITASGLPVQLELDLDLGV